MKVKELKELLASVPDDYAVQVTLEDNEHNVEIQSAYMYDTHIDQCVGM